MLHINVQCFKSLPFAIVNAFLFTRIQEGYHAKPVMMLSINFQLKHELI